MPFVKGQSGNPLGRPKVVADVKAAAREYTAEAIERLATWMRDDNPKASVSASIALLERGWGKPMQPVEMKSNPLGELTTDELSELVQELKAGSSADVSGDGRTGTDEAPTLN